MSDDESSPAFPQSAYTGNLEFWKHGMSLRDYFAAKALSGMLADPNVVAKSDRVAKACYEIADAMLKERIKL